MATQSDRRAATRRAILDAAEKLFRKRGFEETAVEQITTAANVAKGTFYQHFESKTEILLALIRRHEAATVEAVTRKLSEGCAPLQLLYGLILAVGQSFEKDRKMAARAVALAMAKPAVENQPSLRTAFALILAEGQKRGEIRGDVDSYELALMLGGAMLPAIIGWAAQGKKGQLTPSIEKVWRVLLEGMRI